MEPFRWQSPEDLRRKPSLTSIAEIAFDRRVRQTAAKEAAERRVQVCEQQLEVLRQELSDAERELQAVEQNARAWEKYFAEKDTTSNPGVSSSPYNECHSSCSSCSDSDDINPHH